MRHLSLLSVVSLLVGLCQFVCAGNNCRMDSSLVTDLETGLILRYVYQYEGDLLMRVTNDYLEPSASSWSNKSYETYQYDENRNLIHVDTYDWWNNTQQWVRSRTVEYTYQNNQRIEHLVTTRPDSDDPRTTKKTWKYDAYYRVIEEVNYVPAEEGGLRYYQKIEYSYEGSRVISLLSLWKDSVWEAHIKSIAVRNKWGTYDTYQEYEPKNDDWSIYRSITSTYNPQGQIEVEETRGHKGKLDQSYPISRVEYEYDEEGYMASKKKYGASGGPLSPESQHYYTWDSLGNNIGISLWTWQGKNLPWSNVEQTDNYYVCPVPAVERYTLTVMSDDYTLGTVLGSGEYEAGAEVRLTAVPYPNSIFTGWDCTDSDDLSIVFIMPADDATIVATFEAVNDALIPVNDDNPYTDDTSYNILGQPVDDTYHGIVIRNGMKVLQ